MLMLNVSNAELYNMESEKQIINNNNQNVLLSIKLKLRK